VGTVGTPGPEAPSPRRAQPNLSRAASSTLLLGAVLNPVNSSLIAVALIPIGAAFGVGPGVTAWLISSLYLTTAIGQPLAGYLVDRFGARPLFLAGTILVGIGGLLGALAPDIPILIVARVLIGLGTCAAYPAAMWLIRTTAVDGSRPSRNLLTALAVAGQVSSVIGPAIGGLLIGVGGWPAIFLVNLPLAIGTFAMAVVFLPRLSVEREGNGVIDLLGMVLFALTLGTLVLLLMQVARPEWLFVVALGAFGTALVARELRVSEPFLDIRLLVGNRPLAMTFLRQLLAYSTFYAFYYGYVQWLQEGRGLTPSVAGTVMLPMAVSAVSAGIVSGRSARIARNVTVGTLALLVACASLWTLDAESSLLALVGAATLFGIPQGLNGLANQTALYHQADASVIGSAAGVLRTCTYVGALVASAAVAAAFGEGAGTASLHLLATVMLVFGGMLLTVVIADRSLRRPRSTGPGHARAADRGDPPRGNLHELRLG
jgi:MFS family permease